MFSQQQLGTPASPARYELDITAPGYRDRRVAITVTPDATGLLYSATLSALDDQQLARAGGFELVTTNVSLSEVFGLLGNQPMFTSHPLTVSKTVDRDVASGGDRLVYTVLVGSQGAQFGATRVVDTLPAGVVYAPGTARVDGVPVEPQRDGRILTWTFPSLVAQHTITYACVVMPFTADGSTLINVVDVDTLSNGGLRVHGSATADTRVVAGALGNRIVVTGRVFVDAARTGRFRDGDKGVPGVRVFLEDGESVTTDRYGRFTFPSVHPGQHVLRVDTTTLPLGRARVRRPPLRQPAQLAAPAARHLRRGPDARRQLRARARRMSSRNRIHRSGVALAVMGLVLSTVDVNPAGEIPGAYADEPAASLGGCIAAAGRIAASRRIAASGVAASGRGGSRGRAAAAAAPGGAAQPETRGRQRDGERARRRRPHAPHVHRDRRAERVAGEPRPTTASQRAPRRASRCRRCAARAWN